MTYLLAISLGALGFMATMSGYAGGNLGLAAGGILLEACALAYVVAYARRV